MIVFTIFWGIAIAGMLMNVVLLALRVPPRPQGPAAARPQDIFLLMPMHDEEAIVQAAVERFTRLQWPLAYGGCTWWWWKTAARTAPTTC
ncbi:hypothetical protein J5F27_05620 [Schleiferilactobacillus harbinensis]|uniref:hypothetical protein n=1 Tax=Schleiferilactobacillus harbinensis TaxID=304207 RepID=UPI001AAEF838|nr:hypothetical protein [Schleiferilactobacillus harbinensis]MBO3091399.1 hypothetical protein [Schleiferilactobacillus harbinensis]